MGTDINAFIEIVDNTQVLSHSFAELGRYGDFNFFMIQLELNGENIRERGLPDNLGEMVSRAYWNKVVDEYPTREEYEKSDFGYTLRQHAVEWVRTGQAVLKPNQRLEDKELWVSPGPGTFGESWLSLKELEQVIELFYQEFPEPYQALDQMLVTMKELGENSRLVYWFDC